MTIYVVEVCRSESDCSDYQNEGWHFGLKKIASLGLPQGFAAPSPSNRHLHQCLHLIYQNLGGRLEGPSLVHDRVKVCPFLLHKTPELGWTLFW